MRSGKLDVGNGDWKSQFSDSEFFNGIMYLCCPQSDAWEGWKEPQ